MIRACRECCQNLVWEFSLNLSVLIVHLQTSRVSDILQSRHFLFYSFQGWGRGIYPSIWSWGEDLRSVCFLNTLSTNLPVFGHFSQRSLKPSTPEPFLRTASRFSSSALTVSAWGSTFSSLRQWLLQVFLLFHFVFLILSFPVFLTLEISHWTFQKIIKYSTWLF